MARRRFTERQALECAILQGAVIPCYRCNTPFTVETVRTSEREHLHEVALGGPDTVEGCVYSCKDCHDKITRGTGATTAGTSIGRIAKTKRIVRTSKMAVQKPALGAAPQTASGRLWPRRQMQGRAKAWPPRGSRPMNRKRRA